MYEFQSFFGKLWSEVSSVFVVLWACVCWVMFPNDSYYPAAIAVGIGIVVDLITKLYALAVRNGGYFNATRLRVICSDTLWRKTHVKIISYLAILIMTGLSMRVSFFELLGKGIATVVYSVIFVREFQSVIENSIEAGADWLLPLLHWLRRKEKAITDDGGGTGHEKF